MRADPPEPRRAAYRRDAADETGRRLFIAVPLSASACADIAGLVGRVRAWEDEQAGAVAVAHDSANGNPTGRRPPWQVRWVRVDGLHLTLRFLGPTAEERTLDVEGIVEAAAEAAPFPVRIGGAGAFPDPRHPRTLWLGVTEGAAGMSGLAADLAARLEAAGWQRDDRAFRPHLTLARTDGIRSGPAVARELIKEADGFETGFEADRVVLFESHTGGGPARYERLREAILRGGPQR